MMQKARFTRLFLAILFVQCAALATAEKLAVPTLLELPYDNAGRMEKTNINEPSGLVYHPGRGTLFIAGDEGCVTEIGLDGRLVQVRNLHHADFEGITCVPATGMLYLAVEGDDIIVEVDPMTLSPRRTFSIPRQWRGKTVMDEGGAGIEAIAFAPAAERLGGGTFYVANQGPKGKSKKDGPGLAELALPLDAEGGGEAVMLRWIPMEEEDLSALAYDLRSDRLWLVSDEENLLMRITRDGQVEARYRLPGEDQEGIAFDDQSNLYIAQDSGGILKLVPR